MHVAVDEYSRVACVEILPDETPTPRSVGWFAKHGVRAREVISDGGSCYIAHDFALRAGSPKPARSVRSEACTSLQL